MLTQNALNTDGCRRWFLDEPEANVLSAAKERELLVELTDCKEQLLRSTRRPDGSEWGVSIPDADFQRLVHDLASSFTASEPGSSAIGAVARRYQQIRSMLAMANSRLVAHIAKRYLSRGISGADLIQEGFCGLLAAIDRFDTANTTRLGTYAGFWICQAMQRAIAGGAYPVRLNPKQLQRMIQSMPHAPGMSNDPFADADPWSTETPEDVRRDYAAIRPRISLDAPCQADEATPLASFLAAVSEPDKDEGELTEFLGKVFQSLNPREHLVLKLRFGLDGESRQSLSEISKILKVSKERVRQIEERALDKMRTAADVSDFIDSGSTRRSIAGRLDYSPAPRRLERTRAGKA
ncbi:MAG: sigma-70 family RNA polymerase sigma factor [Isosphaeraceae bacterium]